MAGGLRGDNSDRKEDFRSMDRASGSLQNILNSYKRAGDPFDSPFADAIENMRIDTATKLKDATDSFNLQKDQNKAAYSLTKQQGQKGYADQVQVSKEKTKQLLQEGRGQIEATRSSATDAAFSAMVQEGVGGMASAGGRQRKVMSEKAKQQVGTMTLGLKHAQDSEKAQLRASEKGLNRSIEEQALGMDQKNETAQLQMDQTRLSLNRDKDKFIKEQEEAQFNAKDTLRMSAEGTVMDTIGGFISQHSRWGDSMSKNWDPWSVPFDEYDASIGATDDFITGTAEGGTRATHGEGDNEYGDKNNLFNWANTDDHGGWSDERLKENIELVGVSESGINIYEFNFIDESYGKGRYSGVMAQEVPEAAYKGYNGYLRVNYDKIDVKFRSLR